MKQVKGFICGVIFAAGLMAIPAVADTVEKYSAIALFAFVAIPLPGTGAWTGAMIAAILGLRIKHAVPAIAAGVLAAGAVVTAVSFLGYQLF